MHFYFLYAPKGDKKTQHDRRWLGVYWYLLVLQNCVSSTLFKKWNQISRFWESLVSLKVQGQGEAALSPLDVELYSKIETLHCSVGPD